MTEKMKPSGIAWIGDIPHDWNIKRVKYLASLKGRIGWQGLTSDEYIDEGPYLITGIDFQNGGIDWSNCVHISEERWAEAPEIHIKNGDLLITKDGTVGKVAIVSGLEGKASLNSGVLLIRTESGFDKRFLFWVLQSEEFWTWFRLKNAGNSTIIHLYQGDFAEFSYTFPDAAEQQAIADFLDAQCAKIDSVIADIEKQIETLQKYKKSLITEAVTKGLDRSVPMKDSGIEWIGEIPCHWGTNRLRYVASVKTGPFGTQLSADEYVDEGVPIINVKNIGYGSILAEDLDFVPETVADRLSVHRLKIDDIVFGRKGAVDKHAIITDEYVDWVQGSDCIRVRSNSEIDSGYLNYLFDSTYFGSYVMLYAVGSTMPSMSSDILLNARILVPPVHEQSEIAAYLNCQCGKIDAIINNKQAQLDTIRQHKKSLIYEYVTGKKRVTEVN